MLRVRSLASRALFLALLALPACTAFLDGAFETAPEDAAVDVRTSDTGIDAEPPDAGDGPVVWTKVAAGNTHTCGLRSDGSLWCWGNYGSGQLGDGRVSDGSAAAYPQPTPVRVLAAEDDGAEHWGDWEDVTAGRFHTCGRREDGSLWCWGSNTSGQLGDGNTGLSTRPVRVVADEDGDDEPWNDWVEVTAGHAHTCGRRGDDTLWCWGSRDSGRLGDGFDEAQGRATPSRVLGHDQMPGHPGWDDWVAVTAGGSHTCGRLLDGTLWCWGRGGFGQLGDGNDGQDHHRTTPGQVLHAIEDDGTGGWDDWVTVAATDAHTCGRRADGSLWCWGSREHGKLGDGLDEAAGNRRTPVQVLDSDGEPGDAWGGVAVGMLHTCGARADRSLWCWGSGTDGNLGDGFAADRLAPVRVVQADEDPGGAWWDDWVQVTAGRGYTCGLREDGTLWCWGTGDLGQRGDGIGDGTPSTRATPVQVLDPPSDG
jgi:alpha-tubulin suppressor-like RCC1 family protein